MNDKEILMPWRPAEGLGNKMHIHSICDNDDGFSVILVEDNNKKRKVMIPYGASFRAWRETGGLLAKHYFQKHAELYKNEESYSGSLFTITNSEYLKLAADQSGLSVADLETLDIVHYCIITEDKILDILSWGNPKAEFIDVV